MLLTTYLKNLAARKLATYYCLPNGNNYYQYAGKMYTDKEFEKAFPITTPKIKQEKDLWKGDAIGQNGLR